jgi:hypothetical protein
MDDYGWDNGGGNGAGAAAAAAAAGGCNTVAFRPCALTADTMAAGGISVNRQQSVWNSTYTVFKNSLQATALRERKLGIAACIHRQYTPDLTFAALSLLPNEPCSAALNSKQTQSNCSQYHERLCAWARQLPQTRPRRPKKAASA